MLWSIAVDIVVTLGAMVGPVVHWEHRMRYLKAAAIAFYMAAAPAVGEDALERCQNIYAAFLDGDQTEVWANLSPEMRQLFGTVNDLRAFPEALSTNFGEEVEVLDEKVEPGNGLETYTRTSKWSSSAAPIRAQLGIAGNG